MYEKRFSEWRPWRDRRNHEGIGLPGVYAVAISTRSLTGQAFAWRRGIIYIGMTNAVAGLHGRLRQFDSTMAGSLAHGGADRVLFRYRNYDAFCDRAFVAVAPFKCDPASNRPADLKVMGEVARFEYLCLARFADQFGRLPVFNNKKAPKFSQAVKGSRAMRRAT